MLKKLFSMNGILFGVIFLLILIESILNVFGLWVAWNLFGYLLALLLLPVLNAVALISAIASVISFCIFKKKDDNISFKMDCLLPIVFFVLGLFSTIIAYLFVFTWGFGI